MIDTWFVWSNNFFPGVIIYGKQVIKRVSILNENSELSQKKLRFIVALSIFNRADVLIYSFSFENLRQRVPVIVRGEYLNRSIQAIEQYCAFSKSCARHYNVSPARSILC